MCNSSVSFQFVSRLFTVEYISSAWGGGGGVESGRFTGGFLGIDFYIEQHRALGQESDTEQLERLDFSSFE